MIPVLRCTQDHYVRQQLKLLDQLYQATFPYREDRLVSNLAFQTLRKVGFDVEDIRRVWRTDFTPGLSQLVDEDLNLSSRL